MRSRWRNYWIAVGGILACWSCEHNLIDPTPEHFKIAFRSNHGVVVMNDDGTNQRRLNATPGFEQWHRWSPDGSRVAFETDRDGNFEIYLVDADGANLRRLTNHPPGSRSYTLSWSPDGKQIVYASNQDGNTEIYVMNVDGSSQQRLTNHPAKDDEPAWAPDGTQIAFISNRDGNPSLHTMDVDGSNQRSLTKPALRDLTPVWSPDGSKIAFLFN